MEENNFLEASASLEKFLGEEKKNEVLLINLINFVVHLM